MGACLAVQADRQQIVSAITNLLQNAFESTRSASAVTLTAYVDADKLLMDVQDYCGGLGDINKEEMFLPFKQLGCGKPGARLSLELSVSRRVVKANSGILAVDDLPSSGCVLTISLPLYELADAYQPVLLGQL